MEQNTSTPIYTYEKPFALHLYIAPHSCHSQGYFISLIRETTLRIYRLCMLQVNGQSVLANGILWAPLVGGTLISHQEKTFDIEI